uniref:Uncharacterized protein n=1 Tax=Medicago truncatula TaxID=3880 RepID=I3SBB7_MEDTR|nr:unknown [Medicago truncatula]
MMLDLTCWLCSCEGDGLFLSEKKSTSPVIFRSPPSSPLVLRVRLTGNPRIGNILSLV